MWFKIKNQQVEIKIFAKPKAKKTALVKVDENGMNIALHAKPHEGEANKELISFLSEFFKIPKSMVILLKGEGGRYKTVQIPLNDKVRGFLDKK